MAFIYEQLGVSGRLKHVGHQTLARDFDGEQIGLMRKFDLASHQDMSCEVGFLTAQLPGYVAAIGGDYLDGESWIVTLERWPADGPSVDGIAPTQSGRDVLDLHLMRVMDLSDDVAVADSAEFTLDSLKLLLMIQLRSQTAVNLESLSMTEMLRALAAEACGYSSERVAANRQFGCAFPGEKHECAADLYSDVFRGWADHRIRPGDEF